MIQTILNIALAVGVAVLAWKLRKKTKILTLKDAQIKELEQHKDRLQSRLDTLVKPDSKLHLYLTVPSDSCPDYSIFGFRNYGKEDVCFLIKSFPFDPNDASDRDYALNCAQELKEAIEYDWRIKEEKK